MERETDLRFNMIRCLRCGRPITISESCPNCNAEMDQLTKHLENKMDEYELNCLREFRQKVINLVAFDKPAGYDITDQFLLERIKTFSEDEEEYDRTQRELIKQLSAQIEPAKPTNSGKPEISVRYAQDLNKTMLDEILAKNANTHVGRMGSGCWFIGIETKNEYMFCHLGSDPEPGTEFAQVMEHYTKKKANEK